MENKWDRMKWAFFSRYSVTSNDGLEQQSLFQKVNEVLNKKKNIFFVTVF